MATQEHIAKAFDIDLQEIARLLAEMGGLAEKQISDSVDALVRGDANPVMTVGAQIVEAIRIQPGSAPAGEFAVWPPAGAAPTSPTP